MSENNSGNEVLMFAIGGLIGAGLSLLLAPCSGEETRRRLAAWINEGKDQAKRFVDQEVESIRGRKEQVSAAWDAGKKAYRDNSPA